MNISVFIFSWGTNYNYVQSLYRDFTKHNVRTQVINSCQQENDKWHNIGIDKYFNDQFLYALNEFNKDPTDLFVHVQGDTSCRNWIQLLNSMSDVYQAFNYGIYSPIVYNIFDKFHLKLKDLSNNLYQVNMVDETCWSIDKEIIEYFFNHNIHKSFKDNFYGWGYDQVFCAISQLLNKKVMLDTNYEVSHEMSQGYYSQEANKQYRTMRKSLPLKIDKTINTILYKPKELLSNALV